MIDIESEKQVIFTRNDTNRSTTEHVKHLPVEELERSIAKSSFDNLTETKVVNIIDKVETKRPIIETDMETIEISEIKKTG